MKPLTLIIGALVANGLIASNSWAQTTKELDITMSIAEESDSPSAIINRIELPPASAYIAPETTESTRSTATPDITNALDQVQDDLQQTTGDLLNTTNDVLTNTINDALSSGDLGQLPGDIIDNLPDALPEDLLPVPGELIPNPGDLPIDIPINTPINDAVDNPLDSSVINPLDNNESVPNLDDVLDNLEQEQPIPEQTPEPNLPTGEQLLNEISAPLQP